MTTEDALEAMQKLANETGLDLSDDALARDQPQAMEDEPAGEAAAAQASQAQAQPAPAPRPEAQPHQVPLATYLQEREEKLELKRRFEALEQARRASERPLQEPDPFLDPRGFAGREFDTRFQQQVAPVLHQLAQALDHQHRMAATAKYGAEEIAKAETEVMRMRDAGQLALADMARIAVSPQRPNVYENAAEFMRERALLAEAGGDVHAYRERILAEAIADPEFLARVEAARQQGAAGHPQAAARASLTRTALPSVNRSGSGAGSAAVRPHDETDDQLIAWATSRKSARPE
jgi:hypothetical protein